MLTGSRLREKVKLSAGTLWAAGNITRFTILYMLAPGPLSFDALVKKLKVSPSLALHHLKILHAAGWVTKTKFGKLVTYYLLPHAGKEALKILSQP